MSTENENQNFYGIFRMYFGKIILKYRTIAYCVILLIKDFDRNYFRSPVVIDPRAVKKNVTESEETPRGSTLVCSYRQHEQHIKETLETVQRVKRRRKFDIVAGLLADYAEQNADVEKEEETFERGLHDIPNRHEHHRGRRLRPGAP